jgi:hypothetical protein
VLARKPGALPGSTALVQARQAGTFTSAHEAFWAAARRAHGDAGGTRALVEVLLLHRHLAHADVCAGLNAAVTAGATAADVVAVEACKAAEQTSGRDHNGAPTVAKATTGPSTVVDSSPVTHVASLTERRLIEAAAARAEQTTLPIDTRPLPSVAHYDELLRRRPAPRNDVNPAPGADGSTTGRVS